MQKKSTCRCKSPGLARSVVFALVYLFRILDYMTHGCMPIYMSTQNRLVLSLLRRRRRHHCQRPSLSQTLTLPHTHVPLQQQQIQEVTEQELEVEVANRDRPLIIDFFATWCGPCLLLAKELEQVAEEMGDAVKIIKIDCDKNEAISSALQIQGLPTLIFVGMDSSKPALRTEGLLPAQAIMDIVRQELMAAPSASG